MSQFSREQISELIDYLQGTCNSLDDGIHAIIGEDFTTLDLSSENHEQIDGEIFNCDTCNWWYEVSSQSEDGSNCEDCCENYNEEEE
jgi:hypothetical protein